MSTHTHLKNFFPLISPLSKLLYILPLALSLMGLYSSSAIASEDETTHLLGEESPRINSSRSQHNPLESVLVHPIPEVIFDEQLLAIPDKDRAQKQYTVIKDFIALSSEDLFEQFKEKYESVDIKIE